MISYKDIKEAQDILVGYWGNDGEKVIEECARTNPFEGSMETFLTIVFVVEVIGMECFSAESKLYSLLFII